MDNSPIWKYIAFSAMGILVGGAPTYFADLRERPTRLEVSHMIQTEAPITVSQNLKEILIVQTELKVDQARLATALEGVLYELKQR